MTGDDTQPMSPMNGLTWRTQWTDFTGEEARIASFVTARIDQPPLAILVERHQTTGTQIRRKNSLWMRSVRRCAAEEAAHPAQCTCRRFLGSDPLPASGRRFIGRR